MLSGIDVSCIADSSVGGIAELSAMAAICGVVVTLMSPAQLKVPSDNKWRLLVERLEPSSYSINISIMNHD